MRILEEKPAAVKEAQRAQKGYFWALELLVLVLVFVIAQVGQLVIMLPAQIIMMFTNQEYLSAAVGQDMEKALEIGGEIVAGNGYMISMLFSTIMMILLVWLFCRLIQKRRLRTLGFYKKNAGREYLMGLATGFIAFSAAVLLGIITGGFEFNGLSPDFSIGIFLLFAAGFMIQGMAEEVLCRGYFLVSMSRRYPVVAGIMMNSLFFAVLHLFNSGITVLAFINLTLFGVFASVYFLKRGNIWGVGAFHSMWNLVQGNFYGIKVSGMEITCSVFSVTAVEGKDLLNGGAFGLEGSIWVTVVLLAATVIVYTRPTVDTGTQYIAAEEGTVKQDTVSAGV